MPAAAMRRGISMVLLCALASPTCSFLAAPVQLPQPCRALRSTRGGRRCDRAGGVEALRSQLRLPSQIDWDERGRRSEEGRGSEAGLVGAGGPWRGSRERGQEARKVGQEVRFRRMQRYYERRIYDDEDDVDALCSFACFLQVVRGQHDRAALMYECALRADPQRARGIALLLAAEIQSSQDFELFHAVIFDEIAIPCTRVPSVTVPCVVQPSQPVVRRVTVPRVRTRRRKKKES